MAQHFSTIHMVRPMPIGAYTKTKNKTRIDLNVPRNDLYKKKGLYILISILQLETTPSPLLQRLYKFDRRFIGSQLILLHFALFDDSREFIGRP